MNNDFSNQGGFGMQNSDFQTGLNPQVNDLGNTQQMNVMGGNQPMMNQGMMNQGMQQQPMMDQGMMNQGMQQQPMMDQGMMNQGMQQQPMMDQGMMNQGMQQQPMMNQGMMNQGMQQQPMMDQGNMNQGMQQQPMMNQGMMNQGMQQQPMMNQGMMNQSMQQQPMMDQGMMNQGMQQQPMMGNFTQQPIPLKWKIVNLFNFKNKKNLVVLIPIVMVAIILFVLIFNLITTKTLKCDNTKTNELGVIMSTNRKVKFRFGHISTSIEKMVIDYSKSDVDNDSIEAYKKEYRNMMEESCKKEDGCTFNYKAKSKKIIINMKNKYDKDARENIEEFYPTFEEFKKSFDDSCKED